MDILGILRDLWARVVALGNQGLVLIAQVRQVNTQVNILSGTVDNQGQTLIGLNTVVTTIQGQTGSPTYGNQALLSRIDSLQLGLEDYIDTAVNVLSGVDVVTHTQIRDAIAALPAGSAIPSASDTAAGVWNAIDPFSDDEAVPYGQEQANAHRWATFSIDGGSLPSKRSPFFNISYPPPSPDTIPSNYTWPKPDWADIQAYDSLVSWLVRTCADFTWTIDDSGENAIGYLTSLYEPEAPHFTPKLTQTEWLRVYGPRAAKAPIWPGIDGVTLGTPVVCTQATLIVAPMDGILLTLDTIDPDAGQWAVNGFTSTWHGGYVVFLSPEGHAEATQYIGPNDSVFTPKGMTTAGSVVVSLDRAAQITVTPWTLK